MTSLARANRTVVVPEIVELPVHRGVPDLVVEASTLTITVELPGHEPAELEWSVTPSALEIRCVVSRRLLHFPLPRECVVLPGRYVIRSIRGIYEVRMERDPSRRPDVLMPAAS